MAPCVGRALGRLIISFNSATSTASGANTAICMSAAAMRDSTCRCRDAREGAAAGVAAGAAAGAGRFQVHMAPDTEKFSELDEHTHTNKLY